MNQNLVSIATGINHLYDELSNLLYEEHDINTSQHDMDKIDTRVGVYLSDLFSNNHEELEFYVREYEILTKSNSITNTLTYLVYFMQGNQMSNRLANAISIFYRKCSDLFCLYISILQDMDNDTKLYKIYINDKIVIDNCYLAGSTFNLKSIGNFRDRKIYSNFYNIIMMLVFIFITNTIFYRSYFIYIFNIVAAMTYCIYDAGVIKRKIYSICNINNTIGFSVYIDMDKYYIKPRDICYIQINNHIFIHLL